MLVIIFLLIMILILSNIENFIDITNKKLSVVYFAYLKPERWKYIVIPQMQDLVNCGLAKEADINIILSGDEEQIQFAKKEISNIILPVNKIINFSKYNDNKFEYYGIKKLYDLANKNPEKIYLYFHSKGMVYHDIHQRLPLEEYLTDKVVKNWKENIKIFEQNPEKNKISIGCSKENFCWFNFYWVRGYHLLKCDNPIISNDRYYYEGYIGDQCKNDKDDCYNLIKNNKYYDPPEIIEAVANELEKNN
jgi:hypothetical protein